MTAPVHPLTVSSGTAAKLTPDAEDGRQAFALTERQTAPFASRALLLRYLATRSGLTVGERHRFSEGFGGNSMGVKICPG